MPDELFFIQRYGEDKKELQYIVDIPELISMMLMLCIRQKVSFRKEGVSFFNNLTDEEDEVWKSV